MGLGKGFYRMDHTLREALISAAVEAGARIMTDWGTPPVIIAKPDGSPVTATDRAAEAIVLEALRTLSPHPVVAEEAMQEGPAPSIAPGGAFWLVDALDGTREFIKASRDFTVNIALIDGDQPVLGIIHAPAHGFTWWAARGEGAWRIAEGEATRIMMRAVPSDGYAVLGRKRASEPEVMEPFIGAHTVASRQERGSSIKFCLLAQGAADLYPRLGPTYEWDTAAGDIILREAGGAVLNLDTHRPIVYGKRDAQFENTGFIAGPRAAFIL